MEALYREGWHAEWRKPKGWSGVLTRLVSWSSTSLICWLYTSPTWDFPIRRRTFFLMSFLFTCKAKVGVFIKDLLSSQWRQRQENVQVSTYLREMEFWKTIWLTMAEHFNCVFCPHAGEKSIVLPLASFYRKVAPRGLGIKEMPPPVLRQYHSILPKGLPRVWFRNSNMGTVTVGLWYLRHLADKHHHPPRPQENGIQAQRGKSLQYRECWLAFVNLTEGRVTGKDSQLGKFLCKTGLQTCLWVVFWLMIDVRAQPLTVGSSSPRRLV